MCSSVQGKLRSHVRTPCAIPGKHVAQLLQEPSPVLPKLYRFALPVQVANIVAMNASLVLISLSLNQIIRSGIPIITGASLPVEVVRGNTEECITATCTDEFLRCLLAAILGIAIEKKVGCCVGQSCKILSFTYLEQQRVPLVVPLC